MDDSSDGTNGRCGCRPESVDDLLAGGAASSQFSECTCKGRGLFRHELHFNNLRSRVREMPHVSPPAARTAERGAP